MDKVLYIGVSGAKNAQVAQRIHANNLANINTGGFRRDFSYSRAQEIGGEGLESRIMVATAAGGSRFTPGTLEHTGRTLDVAVNGAGWLTVIDGEGEEAFTRAGHLRIGIDGNLLSENGLQIAAAGGGPLNIPPYQQLDIGEDGTISIIPAGGEEAQPVQVGQLKLVKPDQRFISKSEDGLFRPTNGEGAVQDETVQVKTGYLESSNVSAVEEMISMMNLSRHFEVQMKIMKTASEMASAGDRLMRGG